MTRATAGLALACAVWQLACGGSERLRSLPASDPTLVVQGEPPGSEASRPRAGLLQADDAGGEPTAWVCDRVVDDFSDSEPGRFPAGWEPRGASLEEVERNRLYVVVESDAGKALRARAAGADVAIGRGVPGEWDLRRYPVVQWRWKALTLPQAGNETDGDRDDAAASVEAIWMIGFPFMIDRLRYTWSTTLPRHTRASKFRGHQQLLVVESGEAHQGQWRTVRVDLRDHARRLLERDDDQAPAGLALRTDADDTGSAAEALYADIRLCRRPGA